MQHCWNLQSRAERGGTDAAPGAGGGIGAGFGCRIGDFSIDCDGVGGNWEGHGVSKVSIRMMSVVEQSEAAHDSMGESIKRTGLKAGHYNGMRKGGA
jgi:hypothetical protein